MGRGLGKTIVCGAMVATAAGLGAGSAHGAGMAISPPPTVVAEIPGVFTLDVQAEGRAFAHVKYRTAGGAPCAPSPETDSGSYLFNNVGVNGPATLTSIETFAGPGQYQLCGWLRNNNYDVLATLTQVVGVRAPVGSLVVSAPTLAPFNRAFVLTYSGQTEVRRYVYSKIRPVGGAPCAPTYGSDTGGGLASGTRAEGSFNVPVETTLSTRGRFVICSWLAGSSGDLAPLAMTQTVITNIPPVIPSPAPVVSSVKVTGRKLRTTVGLSKGGRVVVKLIGKGRRISIGAVSASGPRTIVIAYTRPRSLATGRYVLEFTFKARGATKVSVKRRYVSFG